MGAVNDIAKGFAKNQLIGYFLILWAATFFFSALGGFVWLAEGQGSTVDAILDGLYYLAKIGCAAVLALLGLKILNEKQQPQ